MEKILEFLNYTTAILLGPLVLLLKFALVQLFVALGYVVAALAWVVLAPALASAVLNAWGLNSTLAMIVAVLFAPVFWLISAGLVPVLAIWALSTAIGDGIKVFFQGLAAAFLDGWQGVGENFSQPIAYFATASTYLLGLINLTPDRAPASDNSPQSVDVDDLKQEMGDVKLESLDIGNTTSLLQEAKGIDPDQLKQAERLVRFHEQAEKLKAELERHYHLAENLSGIAKALEHKTPLTLEDELFPHMEIERPVLLVKEYLDNDQWRTVPGSTKITDYNSLKTWINQNAVIPTTRDSISSPTPYQGKKCRYAYYPFSVVCNELVESSARIKQLTAGLQQLSPTRQNGKVEVPSLSDARHATFYKPQKEVPSEAVVLTQQVGSIEPYNAFTPT
ncbi:hypothetical protein DIZ81_13745 [Legionella taurinensis]|uniref:Coiled coil protein n=1 Tax=Legionella taurinensis TaxID=70611 RepID=A0A3A5L4L0_9GAMM|nr:sensor domain-containing protein [Legionella taurinensis]MDX1838817.1 sensor domain-containing protein [Legionella taurinensis]PUT38594.1 hypothetical protein DB744_13755 [Legionella taurinensis]PUT39503.1 hypothetical protein DB746_13765 [Legionella taurinensis]PUT41625.1 hypothetical protein DB743_13665 [Legionella taurinensis]PUT45006.1 hypothetical protein DB745_13705 [Legionella taurinensis]